MLNIVNKTAPPINEHKKCRIRNLIKTHHFQMIMNIKLSLKKIYWLRADERQHIDGDFKSIRILIRKIIKLYFIKRAPVRLFHFTQNIKYY